MKYIFILGIVFIYSYADVACSHFNTGNQAQRYYDKKLIGYQGLVPDKKGKVCTYLSEKLYVIKRKKGGYSDYTGRLMTKYDCEKLIRAKKRAVKTSYTYTCFDKVTKLTIQPKNKSSGIKF